MVNRVPFSGHGAGTRRFLPKLDGRHFWIVTVAGILATYVMSVTAVWQAGLGLQPLDPSGLMMASLNKVHSEPVYGIGFGHLYHYLNGIALALLYWVLFRSWLPVVRHHPDGLLL